MDWSSPPRHTITGLPAATDDDGEALGVVAGDGPQAAKTMAIQRRINPPPVHKR
jgi:hypothetical protein